MKIAILTSSRADFGIYLPLLKKLQNDDFFQLRIIAFGTHLSPFHGYTISQILGHGFEVDERIESLLLGDSEAAIATSIGLTTQKFATLWQRLKYDIDLIFALGDRYEMFGALSASLPFNLPIAHLHGGETTLGAIDNTFRHTITLMSKYHFTSTKAYAEKIKNLIGTDKNIYNVGALSLDNLINLNLLSVAEFRTKYQIDLTIPTILITFHPETTTPESPSRITQELEIVFKKLSQKYQIVITMPNADTLGTIIRNKFLGLSRIIDNIRCVENFGTLGYFSCMKHSQFLLGNTSSGIIEAASLQKYVINVGNRQLGRIRSENVLDVPIKTTKILNAVKKIALLGKFRGKNVYQTYPSVSDKIIEILKENGN